ncbi:MAG: hypothetical protein AMXMBFR47_39190 [Planctomycetota bacterium]
MNHPGEFEPGGNPIDDARVLSDLNMLLPSAYDELRAVAGAILRQRRPVDSTRTTSLVHDAYVRLAARGLQVKDRSHFLCLASKAMRRALIDKARRVCAAKRGGGKAAVSLEEPVAPSVDGVALLAMNDALVKFAAIDPRKSRIVEMRYFGGLSIEETAEAIGLSEATVKREWTLARAWLLRELDRENPRSE